MSKLNRKALRKMLLKEFKMIGMANMDAIGSAPLGMPSSSCDSCGVSPCGCQAQDHEMQQDHGFAGEDMGHKSGGVSREDCCEAVKCLIECCSCPVTKQALLECCEDILAGRHDH